MPAGAQSETKPKPGTADHSGEPERIDIHQHLNYLSRRPAEFLAHQERLGIGKTVLLPSGTALTRASTREGKANGLAARIIGTEAAARFVAKHPEKHVYFCNEVPDAEEAIPRLEAWLKKGALGIGELKFHLEIDSKPMIRIFEVADAFQVPVLLHFEHQTYNMGIERFHKVLEKFPNVNFIGHAQTWWGNIDARHDQKVLYPTGKITPGGITDRLLADYPNVYGDLSAGSGKKALERDPEFTAGFLDRHQDKLCYGSDCPDTVGEGEKCLGSGQIKNLLETISDPAVRQKIFSGNARKIIGFG